MKTKTVVAALVSLSMTVMSGAALADAAAGKATFTAQCAECHEASDFADASAQEVGETLTHMAAGHVKHKKPIKLTAAEIADVAAYMSGDK